MNKMGQKELADKIVTFAKLNHQANEKVWENHGKKFYKNFDGQWKREIRDSEAIIDYDKIALLARKHKQDLTGQGMKLGEFLNHSELYDKYD